MKRPTARQREKVRERPEEPAVMHQRWRDLLFLHWEWDGDEIQRTLPPGLHVDRFDDRCFLGVVPFEMRGVRPRFLPAVPGLSNFFELNLRTYVHDDRGLPGVWFYSLDANQRIAVMLARLLFSLPYHWAKMQCRTTVDGIVHFNSARGGVESTRDGFRYRARGPAGEARPGSLEYFLLERYVLFAQTRGGLRAGRVHHAPYPFAETELLGWSEHLFSLNGFQPPGRNPDHVAMSEGVDVSVYPLQ